MRITDFGNFIREMPCNNHSFDIKRSNWSCEEQNHYIDQIFSGKDVITLNRFDLYNSGWNIEEFVLKTLMWGYPTKGRGRNIDNLLKNENFILLCKTLYDYKSSEISIERLKADIVKIEGLGLSTMTKFTNFLDTRINGAKAVILDNQIIEVINSGRFDELSYLKGITEYNKITRYIDYITTIDKLSMDLKVKPDQIEMFLFIFGRNLSELIGEEGFCED